MKKLGLIFIFYFLSISAGNTSSQPNKIDFQYALSWQDNHQRYIVSFPLYHSSGIQSALYITNDHDAPVQIQLNYKRKNKKIILTTDSKLDTIVINLKKLNRIHWNKTSITILTKVLFHGQSDVTQELSHV